MKFSEILEPLAAEFGLSLTGEQLDAFAVYNALLLEWNQKMNLTAITDPWEIALKHMIDSLSCYEPEYFPANCSLIDIGTGAGFPGIPLKIFRPDVELTLLDSLNKRLLFLQAVVDALALPDVRLVHLRAEDAGKSREHREKYQVAVSRAVARLNILAEFCLPAVAVGGCFMALKGSQYRQEIEEALPAVKALGGAVARIKPVKLPQLDDARAVIYIRKISSTPNAYPRRSGLPEKKPL